MYNDTLNRVTSVFKKILENDSIEITKDSNMMSDLDFSSLDVILVITEIENEFGVEIPDEYIIGIVTVGDVVDVVEKLI